MEIIIVVAYGTNLVIGNNGNLPGWNLKDDMAHFRKLTLGKGVLMGRKTFESFPVKYRPLPERDNFIVTHNSDYTPNPTNERTFVNNSIDKAIARAETIGYTKLFLIGGGEMYSFFLKEQRGKNFQVSRIIATEVDGIFDGDTFFPQIELSRYSSREISDSFEKGDRNTHNFNIVQYLLK